MRGRCPAGDYARFLEATVGLADASRSLPRRARFEMDVAILRVCESDRAARVALLSAERASIERAAGVVQLARERLAEAGLDAAADCRRRRSLSLVA